MESLDSAETQPLAQLFPNTDIILRPKQIIAPSATPVPASAQGEIQSLHAGCLNNQLVVL